MTKHPNVLEMRGLRVEAVGGKEILHGIDLTVRRGEMLGLVGESGSGKTTAGLAAMGHFRAGLLQTGGTSTIYPNTPSEGREKIVVEELNDDETRFLRGERIAYIPQDPALSLNPAIRVGEQIREVLDIHGYGDSEQERAARVAEVLEDVGLPSDREYQKRWPHQLSGGQQQRIGIAMAFAMFPDLLILDEPTTGLDVSTQAHVLDTIQQMTKRHGVAGIYITHDLAVVADVTDRVAVMLRGDIVEEGPVEQVLHDPQHPYTQRLLASVPDLAGRKTIGGTEASTASGGIPTAAEASAAEVPALEVRDLKLAYGANTVLRGINMELQPGRCTMLLGESGSGKTTLSRSIAGLIDHYTGSVSLDGDVLPNSTRKRSVKQLQGLQKTSI